MYTKKSEKLTNCLIKLVIATQTATTKTDVKKDYEIPRHILKPMHGK